MIKSSKYIYLATTSCFTLILLLIGMPLSSGAGVIDSSLQKKLTAAGPGDEIPVIIKLAGKADLDKINDKEKRVRKAKIIRQLRETAALSQKHLQTFLEKKKTKKQKSLWLINGIAATVPVSLVTELATFPGVEMLTLDAVIHAPVTTQSAPETPAWNITAIHAQELWNLGYTGQGVVVANMDSGVDGNNPDLQAKWRGGANSWFDPNGEHVSPTDNNIKGKGHGTQTMGIMVGGVASGTIYGGTAYGVAPGAQWIAVKIFNDAGEASYSAIHAGFQWLLDPDGNPDTDDAPHVVNNSWGLETNVCNTEFQTDVQTLKTAGIAQVFSAGNDGPGTSTSVSPGNYPEAFSVGAVDSTNTIASFSSRGSSACGGDIYPKVVAPGVDILTTDLFLGIPDAYVTATGTSFASPHVAGAMALLLSAFPALDVAAVETALTNSATDLGATGTDNDYGNGLIDVLGAYRFLKADKIAVYFDGLWYADVNGNGQWDGEAFDRTYRFGFAGAHPVSGDWSGGGTVKMGVYYPAAAIWYLDHNGNGVWDGTPTDQLQYFGFSGTSPVTGNWSGTGTTKIGVYDPAASTWYLDYNGNGIWDGTPTDKSYHFGYAGVTPVTGDWNGSGTTKIGVYDPVSATWYLDDNGNGIWDGTPTDKSYHFGYAGVTPVTGDWNGSGTTKIGVYDLNVFIWYMDYNGNGSWDGLPTDATATFGYTGTTPVAGKW